MALYDVVAANRQAVQSGTALGAQMFNNDLRMQQLRSEQALQRIQMQQAAQKMAFDLEAHNMMVQQQADMTKAMAQVQLESQPTVQLPVMGPASPEGGDMGTTAVPNPHYVPLDQSLMRNVLPVIAKYRPQEADNFVANVAMLPYRQAETAKIQALIPLQQSAEAALAEQRNSSTDLNRQKIEESKARQMKALMGDSYAPGPLQKDLDAIDKAPGLSDAEKDHAKRVRMALEPKQSPLKARISRSDFIEKHIDRYIEQQGGKRQDAIKALGAEYDNLFPPELAPKRKDVLRYNPATGKLE